MLPQWSILLGSLLYLSLLFAIAFHADRRAGAGSGIINHPWIYSLSLAVYTTTWTFYGSVGRAAGNGIGFLPIYLGPTLMAALWWPVLRRMIRISKANRITSIADFIASRYGKSALLGALVTLIAVIGVVPYISLQLKAVSASFSVLTRDAGMASRPAASLPAWSDTTFYIALLLAAFTILFGTRKLDASERHEGMVAAIAFESVVKLLAFLAVGGFVTFGIHGGFADLFRQAEAVPALQRLLTLGWQNQSAGATGWSSLIVLSMLSAMLLPRQFQIAVVENVDEEHVRTAVWLFPLYLLLINIFVLPIAFAGLLRFPHGTDADMFVLMLPMSEGQRALAFLVFIGGLSAATGMIVVESIALSTMICNDLVMPLLLRLRLAPGIGVSRLLLNVRRAAIILLAMLGYGYFRIAGEAYALVSIGLISFAAVAQFAPALLGGMFWKDGTRLGALCGLAAGFALWAYTLLLPSFAQSHWLPASFLEQGPFGIAWLRPHALFGLHGLDNISHALFWSMLVNVGAYAGVSLAGRQSEVERAQAMLFTSAAGEGAPFPWHGRVSVAALSELLKRFLGPQRAAQFLGSHGNGACGNARAPGRDGVRDAGRSGPARLVHAAEIELAGSIGSASAHAAIASIIEGAPLTRAEVMAMLDETSQAVSHSRELERKSRELEQATAELKQANRRLTELDRMKDDFISTVTHELRTPLTSIRAFSEILRDHPDLAPEKHRAYLDIVIKESERLTRLINDVLDLARIEAGRMEWQVAPLDLAQVIEEAIDATGQLFADRKVELELSLPPRVPPLEADRDRIMQVMLNLLSNAVKFCDRENGRVRVVLENGDGELRVKVSDNGPGVRPQDRDIIFDKFRQGGNILAGKPQGTGLGLPICREIIRHFNGSLWLEQPSGRGATFVFSLPLRPATENTA